MKFPLVCCFVFAFTIGPALAAEEPAAPEKKSGFMNRLLHPFGGGGKDKPEKGKRAAKLTPEMKLEPLPLKLSDTNRLKVTLTLSNRTKKLAQLEFPTAQRIEVLLKTTTGKLVEQWSADRAFAAEATIVTINPGERAEYLAEVATREMVAGETYLVEAFFPNHETLRVEKKIVPEK